MHYPNSKFPNTAGSSTTFWDAHEGSRSVLRFENTPEATTIIPPVTFGSFPTAMKMRDDIDTHHSTMWEKNQKSHYFEKYQFFEKSYYFEKTQYFEICRYFFFDEMVWNNTRRNNEHAWLRTYCLLYFSLFQHVLKSVSTTPFCKVRSTLKVNRGAWAGLLLSVFFFWTLSKCCELCKKE